MTPKSFVDQAAGIRLPNVFNPYADRCPLHDLVEGPAIRRANLANALEGALRRKVDTIWIARDLGYRGGRRTGLALTDEYHLSAFGKMLGVNCLKATNGPVVRERTAGVVWEIIEAFEKPIFLWNMFPFHPHGVGDPMSNRCHTRAEREATRPLLISLLKILRPKMLVAIGNDAEAGLAELGFPAARVRHPSYGGKADFISGLAHLYGIAPPSAPQASLAL